jgi:hypothetical protein
MQLIAGKHSERLISKTSEPSAVPRVIPLWYCSALSIRTLSSETMKHHEGLAITVQMFPNLDNVNKLDKRSVTTEDLTI